MQRAVVGLRSSTGKHKVPKFSECLLECFAKGVNSVFVNFTLDNGTLILTECEAGHELRHSPECPIKLLSSSGGLEQKIGSKNEPRAPYIGIATSVVIESSDSYVLLTKRSPQLRASPNVWVFPGGHLELDESVFEAGFREVKEETGLEIIQEKASVLGLWENVYPLLLGVGTPKYHILIVFLHTRLKETFAELTQKIVPNPDEVESYCWVNSSTVTRLFNSEETLKIDGKQYIHKNGEISEKYLDYSSIFNKWLRQQPEPYSGVSYALRKWLDKLNLENRLSKF